jgi:hypothetical protein
MKRVALASGAPNSSAQPCSGMILGFSTLISVRQAANGFLKADCRRASGTSCDYAMGRTSLTWKKRLDEDLERDTATATAVMLNFSRRQTSHVHQESPLDKHAITGVCAMLGLRYSKSRLHSIWRIAQPSRGSASDRTTCQYMALCEQGQ